MIRNAYKSIPLIFVIGSVTRSSNPSDHLSLDAEYHVSQLSLSFLSISQLVDLGYYKGGKQKTNPDIPH